MSTVKWPWRVEYSQKCEDWHPKSLPHVVDADGDLVATPQQYVNHPGKRDIVAEVVCNLIVKAVNEHLVRLADK